MDLFKPKIVPGYVPDTFDNRDVWVDEVYAGDVELPRAFKVEGYAYRDQGPFPFCVSMACCAETRRQLATLELSQPHTFFNAGGSKTGSSIRNNLDHIVKLGAIPYTTMPFPEDLYAKFENWYDVMRKQALSIPSKDGKMIPGYAKVICNERDLKMAILNHGGLIVPVAAFGDYFKGKSKRTRSDDNHVVVLKGWDDDLGIWYLHDSLIWKTNGEHTVDKSYQFGSAYSILALPQNWREIRDEKRSEGMQDALNHYGLKRSLEREIEVANEMLKQFKAFNNQSVLEAAGRFWPLYTNAIAYGGYSYRDIVNDCYNWRRTGEHIFDLNHETREQWHKRVKGIIT